MDTGSNLAGHNNSIATLKKRSDFLRVKKGYFAKRQAFILQAKMDNEHSSGRIGYTVTKKTGNSVVRNRIRRRLREAVKLGFSGKVLKSHDYVIVGRREALSQDFSQLVGDIRNSLDQVHAKGTKPSKRGKTGDSPVRTS